MRIKARALQIELFARVRILFVSKLICDIMSSSNSSRKRHRFTLQAIFSTYEEKEAFERRFEAVCKLLQSVGAPTLDNHGVLCALLDAVERNARPQDNFPGNERVETRSFL